MTNIQSHVFLIFKIHGDINSNQILRFTLIMHNNIWFGSKLGVRFSNIQTSFADWLIYMVNSLKEEDIAYIAAIIYGIWYARNQHVFDNRDIEEWATLDNATKSIQEYKQATCREGPNQGINRSRGPNNQHRQNPNGNRNQGWSKPEEGTIKINCDANLTRSERWGLGTICRDSNGELAAAATWEMAGANEPTLAEAYALYQAVMLARDCCFRNVIFESDCSTVIELVNRTGVVPRSYVGKIITGIKCCLQSFRSCRFNHVNRNANKAAHAMGLLTHDEPNKIWLEDTPPHLVTILFQDLFH
jgi:hypothetical protein